MNLPKELTTVTPLSKYLAMVIFIALPIVGFFLGMRYQEMMDLNKSQQAEQNLAIPRAPTPTPDETVNWKTYRNEEFGFEVKYPNFWMLTESIALAPSHLEQKRNFVQINITNGINIPEGESMSSCQPDFASLVFQIGKLRERQQQTFEKFEDFVDFLIENPERGRPPMVKPALIQTMVGGHNAFKIEEDIYPNCKTGFYYVEQESDRFTTISFITETNADKLITDQILSTFKFTP